MPRLASPRPLDGGRRVTPLFMQDQWHPGLFYHVIGKAVPGEVLFRDDDDRAFFLRHTLDHLLGALFHIDVFCLCGNHFHLAVQTLSPAMIRVEAETKHRRLLRNRYVGRFLGGEISYAEYVYTGFGGALSGYARRYNRRHGRSGQLLVKPTLHGLTDKGAPGERFSRRLGCYIGLNYAKHHLARPTEDYPWSSLRRDDYRVTQRHRVFDLYGGREAYNDYHAAYLRRYGRAFRAFDEAQFFAAPRPRRRTTRGAWVEGEWVSWRQLY